MLAPHDGENAQFRVSRLASEERLDFVELFGRQIVPADKVGSDGGSFMEKGPFQAA